jgi:hypothetical protein
MTKPDSKCWICGSDASTGEHKTKNSDLKLIFGTWTQNNPLYYHDANRSNQVVRGPRAALLKFSNPICDYCNNEHTQPHDRAWEILSSWFRQRIPTMKPGTIVRANRIFSRDTRQKMLGVHLYFVKLFGCSLLETVGKVPLSLNSFGDAIKNNRPHPDLYLRFALGPAFVGASDMHFEQTPDELAQIAGWSYLLDGLQVQVMFAKSVAPIREWVKETQVWHPKLGTSKLVIVDFPGSPNGNHCAHNKSAQSSGSTPSSVNRPFN